VKAKPVNQVSYLQQMRQLPLRRIENTMQSQTVTLPQVIEEEEQIEEDHSKSRIEEEHSESRIEDLSDKPPRVHEKPHQIKFEIKPML